MSRAARDIAHHDKGAGREPDPCHKCSEVAPCPSPQDFMRLEQARDQSCEADSTPPTPWAACTGSNPCVASPRAPLKYALSTTAEIDARRMPLWSSGPRKCGN